MDNFDKNKILEEIGKNSGGKIDMKALSQAAEKKDAKAIINSLNEEDKEKLKRVLNDKEAIKNLLKNPKITDIIGNFMGGGK
ncbi:MAG: hypothetical protein IJP22_00415 [Clostridia bacterium]|nr:hypothetical protein [Clostridia bacterium]